MTVVLHSSFVQTAAVTIMCISSLTITVFYASITKSDTSILKNPSGDQAWLTQGTPLCCGLMQTVEKWYSLPAVLSQH